MLDAACRLLYIGNMEQRTAAIFFRVRPKTKKQILKAAARCGETVTEFLERAALQRVLDVAQHRPKPGMERVR